MRATTRRLIGSWLAGMLVGTGIIAATSPLFVRSYVPLHGDATRGVWTLPPGASYRWRSEGYATTQIGPLGMPGKESISPRRPGEVRVALWGDSQTEGVCVSDRDKLFAQTEALSNRRLQLFPLARSGENAADWITQMPAVEQALDIDVHVILAVDLADLTTATLAPLPPPSETDRVAANASIAATLPAFVIQAARHLLTEADESTPRQLRFRVGPVGQPQVEETQVLPLSQQAESSPGRPDRWRREMSRIRSASLLPILILDAPVSPQIVAGRVITQTETGDEYQRMKLAAEEAGLLVASARARLAESARKGNWPHGFHNGNFGGGHLNQAGNAVIASILVEQLLDRSMSDVDDLIGEGD